MEVGGGRNWENSRKGEREVRRRWSLERWEVKALSKVGWAAGLWLKFSVKSWEEGGFEGLSFDWSGGGVRG